MSNQVDIHEILSNKQNLITDGDELEPKIGKWVKSFYLGLTVSSSLPISAALEILGETFAVKFIFDRMGQLEENLNLQAYIN